MRSFINRMVCFLIVGLMAVSGTFPAMAADDPTWPNLQQSQAEFPAAQDTDVNTDMGIVMAENVKIPSKVKRLVRKYTKEKGKTIYFASPFCQVVRNRSVQLTINKEAAGVTYKSSKPKVARVSKKGVLSTYKRGYTVITATWKKKTCHMVVYVIPSRGALDASVKSRIISAKNIKNAGSQRNQVSSSRRKKTILLAGSSSADRWRSVSQAFSGFYVVNNAIGGTTAQEWMTLYKKLIIPYHPDAVILLVGSNDIGSTGRIRGETCAERVQNLIASIRRDLGDHVPVFYMSIPVTPSRKKAWPQEKTANRLIKKYCSETDNVFYIDLASKFLDKNGKPKASYFASDRLHPSSKGYQVYNSVVSKLVKKVLNGGEKR